MFLKILKTLILALFLSGGMVLLGRWWGMAVWVGVVILWLFIPWKAWVKCIITIPLVIFLIWRLTSFFLASVPLFLMYPLQIVGDSMAPTYKNNAYVAVRILMQETALKQGDAVIIASPQDQKKEYIERIIGLSGEEIEIKEGGVYINGIKENERYLPSGTVTNNWEKGFTKEAEKIIVPQDQYFVLADNRGKSADSRMWGFVSRQKMTGIILFCFWNCDKEFQSSLL